MDARRFLVGTLVGTAAVLAAGSALFWLPPFRDYYVRALAAGSAFGVARDVPLWWAVAVGACAYGALVTLAIGTRAAAPTPIEGLGIGAFVGLLVWGASNFMLYGVSHVGSLATTLVNPLLELVPGALAGWAIVTTSGRRTA